MVFAPSMMKISVGRYNFKYLQKSPKSWNDLILLDAQREEEREYIKPEMKKHRKCDVCQWCKEMGVEMTK